MIPVFLLAILATLGLIAVCVVGYIGWRALAFTWRCGKALFGMDVTRPRRSRRARR